MKTKTSNNKKEVCNVILAKPNYYVIKKGSQIIKVNKKNNYRRGQSILY